MNSPDAILAEPELLARIPAEPEQEGDRCVVRLTTSWWHDKRGAHMRKDLTYLKRQCVGYNVLQEDCDMVGADKALESVSNLMELPDGVYEVYACNFRTDYETGYVDDYDLALRPYQKL